MIGTNQRETLVATSEELDPLFEINLAAEQLLALLDRQYAGWEVLRRLVKPLAFDIERQGQPGKLTSDCVTLAVRKLTAEV